MGTVKRTLEERFWAQVKKLGPDECWEWTGHKSHGYGYISTGSKSNGSRKELRAHRVSWELAHSEIPDENSSHRAVVMHICDNRGCVNPSHLMLGSQSENLRDAFQKGRHKAPGLKGEEVPHAKLTEEQVVEIRAMKGVVLQRVVADQYGVTKGTISHIWTRRNWRG